MLVLVETSSEEASGLRADVAHSRWRQIHIVVLQQLFHVLEVLSIKRHSTTEEDINDDSSTPDIYFAVVGLLHENLRSDIPCATQALREETLVLRNGLSEAEVSQLDYSRLLVDQNIVELNVSVSYVHLVEVVERGEELPRNIPDISLIEQTTLLFLAETHQLSHVAGINKLRHYVEVLVVVHELIDADDVLVHDLFKNLQLVNHSIFSHVARTHFLF